MTFQFKIQLKNIQKPPVWRRVLVPDDITFHTFHEVIQAAFGWDNYHLYRFSATGSYSGPAYQLPDEFEDDEDEEDSDAVKISEVFEKEGQKFSYIYDFGDNWEHTILLEKISDGPLIRPLCTDGKGACPPEDCGGYPGYMNLIKILADAKNPEHQEMKDWLGMEDDERWDVNYFDIKEANDMLSLIGL